MEKKNINLTIFAIALILTGLYYFAGSRDTVKKLRGTTYDVIANLKKGVIIGESGNSVQIDSIVMVDGKYKFYIGGVVVSESDDIRIGEAVDGSTYFWLKTDTADGQGKQLATQSDIENIVGGGSGFSYYKKWFTVGDTGFPGAGDSTITSADWAGRDVKVWRDGIMQFPRTSADGKVGARVNNVTGLVTVHPAFEENELIGIEATDPTHSYDATISGTESPLLAYVRAFWKLDETAGTAVADQMATYNGVTNATVGTVAFFGYGETFNGTTQFVDCGTTVGDVGTSDFALSARIYPTAWPGTYDCAGAAGNWGSYPYYYFGVYGDHRIKAVVNFSGTNIEIFSNTTITLSTWYSIILKADRSGNVSLVVNGVLQTNVADISASSAVNISNNNTFAIGRVGNSLSGHWFTGIIDDVGLYTTDPTYTSLTNVITNSTFPFN